MYRGKCSTQRYYKGNSILGYPLLLSEPSENMVEYFSDFR